MAIDQHIVEPRPTPSQITANSFRALKSKAALYPRRQINAIKKQGGSWHGQLRHKAA